MFAVMDFKNSQFMFLLGGIVGAFVIAQSLYFLIKALKRGKALGITGSVVKKTIFSSAVFAILPPLCNVKTVTLSLFSLQQIKNLSSMT